MIILLLCGAGIGVGLWALTVYVMPPRPSLSALIAGLISPSEPRVAEELPAPAGSWVYRLGRPLIGLIRPLGLPTTRVRADLRITERSIDHYLADKAVCALAGLFLPCLATAMMLVGGIDLSWQLPAVVGLICAISGFFLPDLMVVQDAQRRRRAFRHALTAYLNLVQVLLAGGAGIESALADAASVGHRWAFIRIRRALTAARITRTTPWAALADLGTELQVPELSELATSITLAGTEGARVKASLGAKAAALRTKELTDAEGSAQAATERMSLPVVVLFAGFLLFLGFPALTQVLAGL